MTTATHRPVRTLLLAAVLLVAGLVIPFAPASASENPPHVLVFSGTYGFRHPSITHGNLVLAQLASDSGAFSVEISENPLDLRADKLASVDMVLFNSTTGRIPLSAQQRADFERWVGCGGGFVGVHAAADANYGWAAWSEIVGAQFESHPHNAGDGEARLLVEDQEHPATTPWHGQEDFLLQDEYYRWRKDPRGTQDTNVLLSLDEETANGTYAHHQPLAWSKTFRGGGRVFYTNLGHNEATWDRVDFQTSLVEGIGWVGEVRADGDCLASDEPLPATPYRDADAVPVPLSQSCDAPDDTAVLTLGEASTEVSTNPAPVYFGVARNDFVIDLSALADQVADPDQVEEAVEVSLTARLSWDNPLNDYDLGISSPAGFAGSDATQPLDEPIEEAALDGLWHCDAVHLDVFTHHALSTGAATLDLLVERNRQPGDEGPTGPAPPDLPVTVGPVVIAPPLGQGAGYVNPTVVIAEGMGLHIANLDTVQHDITAQDRGPDNRPLFRSDLALFGEVEEVLGVPDLAPGDYGFYCSLHPAMQGVLTVMPTTS